MNFQQIAKAGFKIFQKRKLMEMRAVEPLRLRSYSEEESGYCRYNPQINEYASESPENLAEVLIFVVATQQVRWPDVVSKFPNLMNHIYFNNGLFRAGEKRSEEGFPSAFSSIIIGKTDAIDAIWKNKDGIFSKIGPIIREYNNSSSIQKEDAAFKLYLNLLRIPRLGLPKAGFAAQLIIGRFGCIDSINSNILELPKDIIGPDNKFKSPGKTKVQAGEVFADLTKGGVEMAKKYADYLKHLEETIKDDISKILWDNWCDIVAYKIKNPRSEFDVELQGGLKGGKVQSDYPRAYKPSNPSSEFMKRFGSDITGQEVSKQHHPELLRLALKERTANFIEKMYGESDSYMTLQEKKMKRIALALKNKVVGETSIMGATGGGAIEGGYSKPVDEEGKEPAGETKKTMAGDSGAGSTGGTHYFDEEEAIVEYLTEAEAATKKPRLGKVTRNPSGSKKKFHVYVKCSGRVKKISFGDPNLSIKRDSPERRKSFRARHKCDKPEGKNRCTARYWSCYQWRAGAKVKSEE